MLYVVEPCVTWVSWRQPQHGAALKTLSPPTLLTKTCFHNLSFPYTPTGRDTHCTAR